MTLEGHSETIYSVAFSTDGRFVATSSGDNTAKIWDSKSGKAILTLSGHSERVTSVAFSPDGRQLVTGSDDKTAKIWNLESGKTVLTLEGHTSWINSVAFSPDGQRLVTGSMDSKAKIWQLEPNNLIAHAFKIRRPASLLFSSLLANNLETILELHPDNEQKLIATGEAWQIVHFAELTENQARNGIPTLTRVEPLYARADRLYSAALALLPGERYILEAQSAMLRRWAEVCKSDGLEAKAAELNAKADRLWK